MSVPEPRRAHHDEVEQNGETPPWCADAVPVGAERAEVLAEVLRWAAEALTSGPDVPVFGSAAWCELPDGVTKTHAAVRAALAWWTLQWASADRAAADHVEVSHVVSAAFDWPRLAREKLTKRPGIPRRD